jgi:replicative DNA helicase
MPEELRSLPKNREAEQVVLGCALVEAETVMTRLTERLRPQHFYFRAHRLIYQTLLELFEGGQPIDLITVGNRLEEKDTLADVGGRAYLSELASSVTTTTSVGYYAEIVMKKALLRELAQVGQEIAELGYREDQELPKLLDIAEEKVFTVSRQTLKQSYHPIGEILHEHLDVLEKLQDPRRDTVTGLATGFKELDKRTAGFHPADLIVVAGRPSMGKSSFVFSIARNVALEDGQSVGIFSLEMTKEQLIERLLCSEARVNLLRLRGGYLGADSEAWRRIMHAANRLQKSRILIDDTPAISVMEMKAKARRMKSEHGLDLLIVDYLQLVEGGGRADVREQEISYIARSLKGLGRELGVPVIACSQLSRAVERRDSKKPRLSDLRESGEIEQTADVVLFLYRRDYYDDRAADEEDLDFVEGTSRDPNVSKTEIIIGKQRNGPTDSFTLMFHKIYASFYEFLPSEAMVEGSSAPPF